MHLFESMYVNGFWFSRVIQQCDEITMQTQQSNCNIELNPKPDAITQQGWGCGKGYPSWTAESWFPTQGCDTNGQEPDWAAAPMGWWRWPRWGCCETPCFHILFLKCCSASGALHHLPLAQLSCETLPDFRLAHLHIFPKITGSLARTQVSC